MRRLVIFAMFIAGCGGQKDAEAPAQPVYEAAPAGAPAQAEPGAGAFPAPPPPPAEDEARIDSGGEPRTVEEALAIIDAEAQNLDASFSAGELTGSCDRVCRALGSMRRAVDGLCELTGSDDDRCEKARDRLEQNEARVSSSGCGC